MPESGDVVMAIDLGTSSTKVILIDSAGRTIAAGSAPVGIAHPRPGWVEQSPHDILDSVGLAIAEATRSITGRVAAVGVSNQRESALAWDTATGEPLSPMLGWQDRRTLPEAQRMTAAGDTARIRSVSGLPLDPMFSALKFRWILDDIDDGFALASRGAITLGTLDAWLVRRLTGETRIERGNASRTQLLSVESGDWDEQLLAAFGIPRAALPTVVDSDQATMPIVGGPAGLDGTRIHSVLGDSHSALFAHGVRTPGDLKATYGSGSSIMTLVQDEVATEGGLVRTIAWSRRGTIARALEGNILATGSALAWMAEIFDVSVDQLAELARGSSSDDVTFVPAFSGLGAPWWDDAASAVVSGMTLGTTRASLARSAFESVAFQIDDVVSAAERMTGIPVERMLVDGGPSKNDWLMQLQADVSGRGVVRSDDLALSALGTAHLAGIGAGIWTDEDVLFLPRAVTTFSPDRRQDPSMGRRRWENALRRSRLIAPRGATTSGKDPT